jgi:hypothetical protein
MCKLKILCSSIVAERNNIMDIRNFEKIWETEYICLRVNRISEDIKDGNFENALDYLAMIQEKAKIVEKIIKAECSDK